jgi:hypothetical protein
MIMPSEDLVDIRDVRVNTTLSKEERVKDFVRQIKDPFRCKCETFTVVSKFVKDGPSLEDCLRRLLV